ncbi:MAG: DNA methyltransferase [Verrucomicrobiota bacterium]
MQNISWNEVRDRAIAFSRRWATEASEAAGKQTFWNEFFAVFGRDRRTVASFEVAVRNLHGDYNYIDLLWRGMLLVEHKSAGKSLAAAESQAFAYIEDLARECRFDEIPRFVIVSDFARFALYDLEPEDDHGLPLFAGKPYAATSFPLAELHRYARHFAFLKGERTIRLNPEDPANQKAYDLMCELHDTLEAQGFMGTDLERLLVRLLFCLFADDTGVFEPSTFETFIRQQTREDGSDVGARLNELFDVLNTPEDRWPITARDTFAGFRYINGELFQDRLAFPPFTRRTRDALAAACEFQWARVSPAVFGSLFQGIMDDKERRQQGAHYTSERDILKVVHALFLDELKSEFETIRADRSTRRKMRLEDFHKKLRKLRLMDPACGCGNFLVLSYRELRQLELELLKELHVGQQFLDVRQAIHVDVDQFYGIEYSEWPKRIAEVAMWLMDHQMNQRVSEVFGQSFERLPLRNSPHIVQKNALTLDWRKVLAPEQCTYVLGNPPFVGKHYQSDAQKADMRTVFGNFKNLGDIDYVVCWFRKAAEYIQGTKIKVGFVSTNSITQGEQVPIVWGMLFGQFHIKIHFAHRTFAWVSEARGAAHVHVVIIGFAAFDTDRKTIVDYEPDSTRPSVTSVSNISPYLTPGSDSFVTKRTKPLADVPEIRCGNKPSDGGYLILTDTEKAELLREEPGAERFLRRFTGSEEFINGNMRWCLWLVGATPAEMRALPKIMERVQKVRVFRERSTAGPTRAAARTPWQFFYLNPQTAEYILIPEVSSERRSYVPIGIVSPEIVSANTNFLVPTNDRFIFGVLTSAMHMDWLRVVGGRLESRYRYSGSMVYNTFPWPSATDPKRRTAVETAAQLVLDARKPYLPPDGEGTLADLYDPLTMPLQLARAHAELDIAVDRCYRSEKFHSSRERVEHLFALYESAASPLLPVVSTHRGRSSNKKRPTASDEMAALLTETKQELVQLDMKKSRSTLANTILRLPRWYHTVWRNLEQGFEDDGMDEMYAVLGGYIESGDFETCDKEIAAIAEVASRSPVSALIGLLTITRDSAERLPSRAALRKATASRLRALGKEDTKVLQGL